MDHLLGGLYAKMVHKLTGVKLELTQADAGKVAWTHSDTRGKRFDGQVGFEVFKHINLKLTQRLEGCCLPQEHVAELRLSAGTHKKHDKLARNGQSGLMAKIFFDQSEGEIH